MTTTVLIPDNALAVIETAPFTALTISLHASLATLTEVAIPAGRQVRAEAVRLGLDATVASQWLYTGASGHPDDEFDLAIALPVNTLANVTPNQPVVLQNVPAFRCAQYTYTGPWSNLGEIYDALFLQFYAAGHVYDGRVREIYRVVDMDNLDNCVTDIQIGMAL